jgi:hypothetical protein
VKCKTGSEAARYAFNLEGWSIEGTAEKNCLIATLTTAHGFEVSFAIPYEACHSLGWNLQQGAEDAIDESASAPLSPDQTWGKLN